MLSQLLQRLLYALFVVCREVPYPGLAIAGNALQASLIGPETGGQQHYDIATYPGAIVPVIMGLRIKTGNNLGIPSDNIETIAATQIPCPGKIVAVDLAQVGSADARFFIKHPGHLENRIFRIDCNCHIIEKVEVIAPLSIRGNSHSPLWHLDAGLRRGDHPTSLCQLRTEG